MRAAPLCRAAAATLLAVPVLALSGCFIPSPPPVPRPESLEPVVQGPAGASDVRSGFIVEDGAAQLELRIDERAAVVIVAASPDDEDLMLLLTGGGVELENDDGHDEAGGFAFDTSSLDPLLAAVLEPGSYTIEVSEFGGDATSFELQVITSTDAVDAGATADLTIEAGRPAIAFVTVETGQETISAQADFDTLLWAQMTEDSDTYRDDDSGGDRNPSILLFGEVPQDIVVVAWAFEPGHGRSVTLSVE